MYHIRKTIAEEYINEYVGLLSFLFHLFILLRCSRDDAKFLEDYPQHVRGITPLFKAIQARRIQDGLARSRVKRKV